MFTRLDDDILVYGQIAPADLAVAKAQGVTTVINNRPDDEVADQPSSTEIAAAAAAQGLAYHAIPVTHSGFSLPQVDAMAAALDAAEGQVLAFCRSGTRSTLLWALTQAKAGADLDQVAAKARAAGYDVSPIRPAMDALAGG